jgi:CheY-like chemotaxis protein
MLFIEDAARIHPPGDVPAAIRARDAHMFSDHERDGPAGPMDLVRNLRPGRGCAHDHHAGKGSRFVVQLPRAAPIATEISRAEPATGKFQPRRVVVIEDSEDIRETLGMILAMWGHEVSMADHGMAGIDCIRAQRPDVALIDIGLPGMSGYDVARAVRRDMPEQRIRLVAITGYGQPADRARAMQAGFDAHLLKPIAPQMLKELLEQS